MPINGGDINISASDDGINASRKLTAYNVRIEINGGTVTVNAQSPFDYDGTAQKTGGTIKGLTLTHEWSVVSALF